MKVRTDKRASWLMGCMVLFSGPATVAAQETEVPITLLGACVACHGADGIGKAPQYPNLAGQKAAYLQKQLKAFRSGERTDPNMSALAKPLSDEDIARLAAYFESLGQY